MNDAATANLPAKRRPGNPNWIKGVSGHPGGDGKGNPHGNPKNFGTEMAKYRRELSKAIRGKYGAKQVIEAMEILYEHFSARGEDGKPLYQDGWQKSLDLWLDRVVGKPKVEDDASDDGQSTKSRADIVIEIRRSFGLTIDDQREEKEIFEGSVVRLALPAPTPCLGGEAGGDGAGEKRSDTAGPVGPVLPVPEEVDQ